jgi:hypothetical protein
MKVRNVGSNMTELVTDGCTVLFSYETPVAAYTPTQGYVRTAKWYSQTTTRHINKWLDGLNAEEMPQAFFDNITGEV